MAEIQNTGNVVASLVPEGAELNLAHGAVLTISGPATKVDAYGNPAPDPDPAGYAEGTLYHPTSYPHPGEGAMVFQRRTIDGEPRWVWTSGTYRVSQGIDHCQRDADGSQRCWRHSLAFPGTGSGVREVTWVYPMPFANIPALSLIVGRYANAVDRVGGGVSGGIGSNDAVLLIEVVSTQAGSVGCSVIAQGLWK